MQLLSPINQAESHNAVYKLSSLSNVAEQANLLLCGLGGGGGHCPTATLSCSIHLCC